MGLQEEFNDKIIDTTKSLVEAVKQDGHHITENMKTIGGLLDVCKNLTDRIERLENQVKSLQELSLH